MRAFRLKRCLRKCGLCLFIFCWWRDCSHFCSSLLHPSVTTASLVLWNKSLHGEVDGRVHLHAMLSTTGGLMDLRPSVAQALSFESVRPGHLVPSACGKAVAAMKRINEGHFYLQADKLGQVHVRTNWRKTVDFHVTRRYVFNLYTVGKLPMEACRAECAAKRDGVLAAHRELDFQKKLENDAYVEARAEQIAMLLASSQRAFKPHTTTVLAFMAQFTPENYGVLKRSKPLVLNGPTRVAKSSYLESLYGIAATLTVNCQGVEEPPLQELVANPKKYRAILFEECDWRLVHRNKLLFQGSHKPIILGKSRTNIYIYTVLVYQLPLLIASNDFWSDIDDEARDYVSQNIFYQEVSEPLYV